MGWGGAHPSVKMSFDLVEGNLEDIERITLSTLRSYMLSNEHYMMTSWFGIHAGIPERGARYFYDCAVCLIAMQIGSFLRSTEAKRWYACVTSHTPLMGRGGAQPS
jgi:hypothetical protein